MAKAYGGELEKERRQKILTAAAACVTEEGIDGATMKKVAARAGVSTGMIAYYFKDKNELMIETLSSGASRFRGRITDEAGAEPGLERLRTVFDLAFPLDRESGAGAFYLEFAAHATRNDDLKTQHVERVSTVQGDLRRCIARAAEDGLIRSDIDPEMAADLMLAVFHGFRTLITVDSKIFPRERAHQLRELALSLLGTPTGE